VFAPEFRAGLAGVTETWLPGFEGLRKLWLEWLEPWDTYRAREERIEDLGDGRVLWLGQDTGTRVDGTGDVVMASSAIWTVRDGKVTEAVFYADRVRSLRDAGLAS
jgi:ketosteroid isomerase-like protein